MDRGESNCIDDLFGGWYVFAQSSQASINASKCAKGSLKIVLLFVQEYWGDAHNLAYLAMFSSVGGGKRSGVNLLALDMLPAIFILPCMKAI